MRIQRIAYGALALAAALTVAACSSTNPAAPSPVPTVSAASYALTGNVQSGGGGVEGVEIALSRDGFERRAVSDADGEFRIAGLEAGEYTATLKCKGYAERAVTITINGNVTFTFDLLPAGD